MGSMLGEDNAENKDDSMLDEGGGKYDQYATAYEAFDAHRTQNADGSYTIGERTRQEIVDHFEAKGKLKTTYEGKAEDFPKEGVVW